MRALVVGLGRMGGFHARALRDLGLDVTTADPDPSRGADYARAPERQFHVACIATPIPTLAAEAYKLASRCRTMLIEKPMATNHPDALDLSYVLEGRDVAVGYVERFNPVVQALRADRSWDRDSRVVFRRWNTRPSVLPTLDLATHDADLARYLGLRGPVEFDSRASSPVLARTISVDGGPTVDLTAHDANPLYAMWRDILTGGRECARPADAVAALAALSRPEVLAA